MRKIPKKYKYTKLPNERVEKPIKVSWSWTALGRMIVEGVRG